MSFILITINIRVMRVIIKFLSDFEILGVCSREPIRSSIETFTITNLQGFTAPTPYPPPGLPLI